MRARLLLAAVLMASPLAAQEKWFPSKYGTGDTKGATNNLSPEATKKAATLVKTGRTYALGVVTGADSPAYPGRNFGMAVIPLDSGGGAIGANKVTGHDDLRAYRHRQRSL